MSGCLLFDVIAFGHGQFSVVSVLGNDLIQLLLQRPAVAGSNYFYQFGLKWPGGVAPLFKLSTSATPPQQPFKYATPGRAGN